MICLLFSFDFSLVSVLAFVRRDRLLFATSQHVQEGLTGIGEVRLVSPDLRRDILLPLS
jgi:hypothetical protein